jgi:hypothetical protein
MIALDIAAPCIRRANVDPWPWRNATPRAAEYDFQTFPAPRAMEHIDHGHVLISRCVWARAYRAFIMRKAARADASGYCLACIYELSLGYIFMCVTTEVSVAHCMIFLVVSMLVSGAGSCDPLRGKYRK